MSKIYVEFEELYDAYLDCRRRKRSKERCLEFELNETENLYKLYEELNDKTYSISPSYVFIHHEPETDKYREIFAANIRDRIVQHLVTNRINKIFEDEWTDRSFSCRKGKGTDYAIKTLVKDIEETSEHFTKDIYVANFDIYSFFASIDKDILYDHIEKLILRKSSLLHIGAKDIDHEDVLYTLYLIKLIIYNDCRKDCIFMQPRSFWNHIPKHKCAFYAPPNKYLAVGNITSQMFANILLADLDKRLEQTSLRHGRYVDDMYEIVESVEQFHKVESIVKEELSKLQLKLQDQKTRIQPYQNGTKFVGKLVKFNRTYILNKTKGKFIKRLRHLNKTWEVNQYLTFGDFEYSIGVINSFLGLLSNCKSYKLRKSILYDDFCRCLWKYCSPKKGFRKLRINKMKRNHCQK